MSTKDLTDRLTSLGYVNLFMRLDDAGLNELWDKPGAQVGLTSILMDQCANTEARFLAAEILFERLPGFPPDKLRTLLGQLYVCALSQAEMGNPWGLPGELDGQAGQHLVKIGGPAIKALFGLLDDQRQILYAGSEEATFGNSFRYRIKDLAAFYISKIGGHPYVLYETPEARDTEINRLRAMLQRDK
jgi:hypothetical protein